MNKKTLNLSDSLYAYLLTMSVKESAEQSALRQETSTLELARMQISMDQAQLMSLLVKMLGAKRIIEIGVFTGYSSLAMALALPHDGQLFACDINAQFTDIAQRYWDQAAVRSKIQLTIAPALDTLQKLLANGEAAAFDMAFIDADKINLIPYYETCLKLVRAGGLILIDNVLWGGTVIDSSNQTEDTRAVRAFNLHLASDKRVDICMLAVADGLSIARIK